VAERQNRKPNLRSSIYQGADGFWHGWVTVGLKSDGSPDRRHRKGKTEAEVTRRVRDLEKQRDTGRTDKPGRKPTVAEWMTTYLDTICARLVSTGKMAPRTLDDYRSKNRNWITPHLGKHRLDRLQPDHLDTLYTAMAEAGKAESHILKVHRILSRALTIAMRRDKVGRNIATLIDAPGSGDVEIEPLTQAEARRLLAAAERRRNGIRWTVGLALGLRQGEALGLRWKYIDQDTGQVKVWWQLQRTTWQHGCHDPVACTDGKHRARCQKGCLKHASRCPKRHGGGLVFRPPKGKSKRTIPLPPQLVPLLEAHREVQEIERMVAGKRWTEHDLVFSRPDGTPTHPRDDWGDWKALLADADVRDVRIHDGRHTAGTLLIAMGVHVRTVQEILGHADIRTTQRYTHVASPMAKDAANQMGQALWGPSE
jgi:integrase